MSVAKKDFKNIYESGVKDLSHIELEAIEKAQDEKTEHTKQQKKTLKDSLDQLENKSDLLQVELKQSINESLKKIQDTLAIENSQSQAFLASLIVELKTLTDQMKIKLGALKQSHNENVDFAKQVASERFLTSDEEMSFAIEHALSNAIQSMGSKAKAEIQSLQASLEKSLFDVQGNITEVTKTNLVSLKDESYTIADHSSSLLKTFFVDSQNKLGKLETSARQASKDVETSSLSLLQSVSDHATQIEKEINVTYESVSTTHFQNADNRLSKLADELSTLHDTTTEKLISATDELSDDLTDRSKKVQEGLRTHCQDVVNRLETLFGSFQTKLDDRLEFSRGQKQALESDKNRILVAVQNEMLSIQKGFATKISGMLDQSKVELLELTKSVEEQMLAKTDSLADKMSESANSIKEQIENEVTKFLQEISGVRSAAIEEISVAAKGTVSFNSPQKAAPVDEDDKSFADIETKNLQSSEDNLPISEVLLSSEEKATGDTVDSEESIFSENKTKRGRKRKDGQE